MIEMSSVSSGFIAAHAAFGGAFDGFDGAGFGGGGFWVGGRTEVGASSCGVVLDRDRRGLGCGDGGSDGDDSARFGWPGRRLPGTVSGVWGR
jgi:hypothetical protein